MALALAAVPFMAANADTDRNPEAYKKDPSLLLGDAEDCKMEGNFEKAISLYKTYESMTGKSMSSEIKACEYPSWIDTRVMKVIPDDDYSVLVVYDNLYSTTLWTDDLQEGVRIEGYPIVWNTAIGYPEFNTISFSSVYMPDVGLYGGRQFSTESLRGRGDGNPNKYQPVSRTYCTGKVFKGKGGEKEFNGGYITTKEIELNGTVKQKIDDSTKQDHEVFFYPVARFRNENGTWTQEEIELD